MTCPLCRKIVNIREISHGDCCLENYRNDIDSWNKKEYDYIDDLEVIIEKLILRIEEIDFPR